MGSTTIFSGIPFLEDEVGGGEGSKILEPIQGRPLYQQKLLRRGDWYRGEREKIVPPGKS